MIAIQVRPCLPRIGPAVLGLSICLLAGNVAAQEWHGRHERGEHREMFFDNRFHHSHYYPAIGVSISALPAEAMALSIGANRIYFHAGVWYRPAGPRFVVIRPPIGVVVPVLPPSYTMVWAGGAPYYYADETYYVEAPGGYAVAAAPTGAITEATPSGAPETASQLPPAAPADKGSAPPAVAQQTPGSWYYCASSRGYYPYVRDCKEGWQTVPAVPPAAPN